MKLSTAQFKTLSFKGVDSFSSALFYGEEEAFVMEKVYAFIRDILKLRLSEVTSVEGETLVSKAVFLNDLLGTRMFWGDEKKVIWIKNANERVTPLLAEYVESKDFQGFLIVTAEKYLKPASKMRQYYEAKDFLLSMGCFSPTIDEIRKKIESMLQGYGKDMSVPLLNQISEIFSKSPMVLDGEIQKIVDYVGEKSFIEMEDIEACLSVGETLDYDTLLHAFLAGTPGEMIHYFRQQVEEGGTPIGVIRNLLMQARRLYALKCLEQEGLSFDRSMMQVNPPIFGHQGVKIKEYLRQWSSEALQELMVLLMRAEVDCKNSSDLAHFFCERAFVKGMHIRKRLKLS